MGQSSLTFNDKLTRAASLTPLPATPEDLTAPGPLGGTPKFPARQGGNINLPTEDDPDAFAAKLRTQAPGGDDDPDAFAAKLRGKSQSFDILNPDDDQRALAANIPYSTIKSAPRGTMRISKPMYALQKVGETAAHIGATVDPRTPEGRRNLAGNAAGLGMAVLTEGGTTLPWITRMLATPLAAAAGGATAEAGEQVAGTKPVTSGQDVLTAGAEQGAYELGGKLMMWPLRRAVATFKAAPAVAKQAAEALNQKLTGAKTYATEEMDRVRDLGRKLIGQTTEDNRTLVRTARRSAGADVARTKSMAAADVAQAEVNQADAIKHAQGIYDDLAKDAPSVLDAGKNVRAVVQPRDTPAVPKGPAQRALDMAGARVSEAAQSGPPIAVKPLQDALDQMASQARPAAIFNQPEKSANPVAGFVAQIRARRSSEAAAAAAAGGPGSVTHGEMNKLEKAIRDQLGIADEKSPLPGLLGKIASMEPGQSLSFADAHQLKKLLDEGVNFDRTAKGHLEQLTKGLRSQLRDQLSVHEPYNQATRAFQETVPLYRRGVGKQLIKAAQEDPDKVVRLLSAKDPARAQAIKDLLVTQSAAGGDAEAGQRAWQSIQSAWVHTNIIRGGADKLSQRLATQLSEHPEFARVVLNDPTAHRILSNIDAIGQAYHTAVSQTADRLTATKQMGQQAVSDARTAGAERITTAKDMAARRLAAFKQAVADTSRATARAGRAQVEGVRQETDKFRQSSLGKYTNPARQDLDAADLVRAGAFGIHTMAGGLSLVRLLSGPKAADLVEWAAYSDQNTRRLVAALQSRLPDSGVAALMREAVAYAGHDDSTAPPARRR